MADGKVVIDVILDDGSVEKGVADVDGRLDTLGGTAKKSALGIGKIVTALGLVALAKKGIDMVRDSIQGAFQRIDTMEQFERVMSVMVDDTDAVAASMDRLQDIVEGTSMRTDVMASGIQNFVTRGMEIDQATDTVEAWGNAVAFYGDGSNEQFSNVTDALQNMVAKGKVGMDQLNRLYDSGIPAVEMYADAVGMETEEVESALSNGEIAAEDFVNTVTESLMKGTDEFPSVAGAMEDLGMSWGAVLENIGNYVQLGMEDIIEAIDDMLENNGLPTMREMLDEFGQVFGEVLSSLADKIPGIADKIMEIYNALEPWIPLLKAIGVAVVAFITTFATIQSVISIINMVRNAIWLMNAALMANPIGLVVAAIVAAVALIYVYWEPISEFFIWLWDVIKDAGLAVWDWLKEAWQSTVDFFVEIWSSIVEFFSGLWDSILQVVEMAYEWLNEKTNGAFGVYVDLIQSYLQTALEVVKSVWTYIKETFSNFLSFIKSLVTLDFEGMKDAMDSQMETAKKLLSKVWEAIRSNIGKKLKNILSAVVDKFNEVKSNIRNKITEAKDALVQKFVEMVTNAINKAAEIVNAVRNKFNQVKNAIRQKLVEAVRILVQKVAEMPGKVRNKITNMVNAGKDLVRGLINGIKNMGRAGVEAITGVVDGIVNKAKSLLKISSPSKLFEQFGKWIPEGLANGIDRMKGAAEKASGGLALGVEGAFDPQLSVNGLRGISKLKGISADSLIGNLNPGSLQVQQSIMHNQSKGNRYDDSKVIKLLEQLVDKDGNVYLGEREVGEVGDKEQAKRTKLVGRRVAY